MRECPWCGGLLEPVADGEVPVPHAGCGQLPTGVAAGLSSGEAVGAAEMAKEPAGQPIARFRSAAEAGYFAHELDRVAEIEATVHVSESFDGLTGAWQPWFILHVAPPQMSRATELLADWLEHGGGVSEGPGGTGGMPGTGRAGAVAGDLPAASGVLPRHESAGREGGAEDFADESDRFRLEADESGIPWWPVMLTLAAGSLVVWTARRWHQPVVGANQGRPMKPEDLPAARLPQDLSGRWVWLGPNLPDNEPGGERAEGGNRAIGGEDRPVISIRSDGRGTVIRSDHDGNGQYEVEYRFPPQAP